MRGLEMEGLESWGLRRNPDNPRHFPLLFSPAQSAQFAQSWYGDSPRGAQGDY